MPTKHLCVSIHIRNKGEVGTVKYVPVIFLLSVPRVCFFCGSFFVIYVSCLSVSYYRACFLHAYGHLLGKS